ncbi:4-hydroxy-tetrahydrodipicolinate synthase [Lentibacillus salicampi]|uniref:4-hydroxy-tetrahydrodipicolinate synthase n=1 Tax=Lentibacillus salicampi TaxID=175306 RepID=A0A4Y9AK66_9BACI|nr:4-hydroxy-tetrahydrodipicolinate synthase [Lentibacillus salicampi]TFJ94791.1 4-hydroxy-tetrahydrodipicolinate synthase [Lentibacillus salicampi]
MMDFGKVLTAMVTPFDANGQIDFAQTTELIEYLLDNGSEGLVVGGTTGESPTLSNDEKIALFRHTVKIANNRVPVIAGTGSNHTEASITLTKAAEEAGADGVMLVVPYYNKPNEEGLYQHFTAIAKETTLPVMLYNIPGRSVVKMNADTIVRLSEINNIVAVKEASGDLDQVSEIIEQTSDDFLVYSGEDSITLPMLSLGSDGVVSVASHVAGNEIQDMVRAYQSGDVTTAASMHRRLLPIMKGLFAQPSPVPVKTALNMKGIDVGSVRLPLVPLTDPEKEALKNLMQC